MVPAGTEKDWIRNKLGNKLWQFLILVLYLQSLQTITRGEVCGLVFYFELKTFVSVLKKINTINMNTSRVCESFMITPKPSQATVLTEALVKIWEVKQCYELMAKIWKYKKKSLKSLKMKHQYIQWPELLEVIQLPAD